MRTERTVNNGQEHLLQWYIAVTIYVICIVQIKSVSNLVRSTYNLLQISNVAKERKDMSALAVMMIRCLEGWLPEETH